MPDPGSAARSKSWRARKAQAEGRTISTKPRNKHHRGTVLKFETVLPPPVIIQPILTPQTFGDFLLELKRKGYIIDKIQNTLLVCSITAVDQRLDQYVSYFPTLEHPILRLTYPGGAMFESFVMARPKGPLIYDPVSDMIDTVWSIAQAFSTHHLAPGRPDLLRLAQSLETEIESCSLDAVQKIMIDVNKTFELLPPLSTLSQSFHREVIEQVYRRSAKPFLDAIKLRAKDTWSNHVYGELMPALLDKMFQRAGLNRSSLFLDLGSGVGTVVAQAALGTGCSAVGIEISPGPSSIATTLLEQAEARGRVWGLNAGSMLVERGDMFESETVSVAVSSADMVLLNNRAFNEETHLRTKEIISQMKKGSILVSLRSFQDCGQMRSGFVRHWDIGQCFRETLYEYERGEVSWSDKGGKYYWSERL